MTPSALDAHFDAAGLKAALEHPKAKLWANANHVDNFTAAIAETIEHAIIGAFDHDNDSHCEWLNTYVKDAAGHWKPHYKGELLPPCYNSRVQRIAAEAYKQLRTP